MRHRRVRVAAQALGEREARVRVAAVHRAQELVHRVAPRVPVNLGDDVGERLGVVRGQLVGREDGLVVQAELARRRRRLWWRWRVRRTKPTSRAQPRPGAVHGAGQRRKRLVGRRARHRHHARVDPLRAALAVPLQPRPRRAVVRHLRGEHAPGVHGVAVGRHARVPQHPGAGAGADGDSEGVQCTEAGGVGAVVVGAWLHVGAGVTAGVRGAGDVRGGCLGARWRETGSWDVTKFCPWSCL